MATDTPTRAVELLLERAATTAAIARAACAHAGRTKTQADRTRRWVRTTRLRRTSDARIRHAS